MYFHIGKVFSFDILYCLCLGIWLNKHYVNTLGLYWLFGVVNLKYKKCNFLDLQEAMNYKSHLAEIFLKLLLRVLGEILAK